MSSNRALLTVKAAGPTLEGGFFLDLHIKVLHMGSSSMDECNASSMCRDIICCSPLTPFGTGDNPWFKVSDASTGVDFRWQMKNGSVHVFCVNGLGTHMVFVPATKDDAYLFVPATQDDAKSSKGSASSKNILTRRCRGVGCGHGVIKCRAVAADDLGDGFEWTRCATCPPVPGKDGGAEKTFRRTLGPTRSD
jgi:hypothetical protein